MSGSVIYQHSIQVYDKESFTIYHLEDEVMIYVISKWKHRLAVMGLLEVLFWKEISGRYLASNSNTSYYASHNRQEDILYSVYLAAAWVSLMDCSLIGRMNEPANNQQKAVD